MEAVERRDKDVGGDTQSPTGGRLSDELFADYHALLCRLGWPGADGSRLLRTLGLTSSRSGEGTSTVTAALAVAAAASSEQRILLVDANLRRPSVHRSFSIEGVPGLCEVLLGEKRPSAVIHATEIPRLSVLAVGRATGPRWHACVAADWSEGLEALRSDYGLLLFDLPVANDPLTLRLAGLLDGLLVVVEADRTSHDIVQRNLEWLSQARAQVLGAVLNKHRR